MIYNQFHQLKDWKAENFAERKQLHLNGGIIITKVEYDLFV
jgi:hypothetical protein